MDRSWVGGCARRFVLAAHADERGEELAEQPFDPPSCVYREDGAP